MRGLVLSNRNRRTRSEGFTTEAQRGVAATKGDAVCAAGRNRTEDRKDRKGFWIGLGIVHQLRPDAGHLTGKASSIRGGAAKVEQAFCLFSFRVTEAGEFASATAMFAKASYG